MTKGPGAMLAEIVENPARSDLHRHPLYYALRNRMVDFLVTCSKSFAIMVRRHDPRTVAMVRIEL